MKKLLALSVVFAVVVASALFSNVQTVNADPEVDAALTQAIAKLNNEQKAALLVLVKGIVEAQSSESPVDGAMKTVSAYVKAAEEADIETLMEQISEEFSHYEVGSKSGYRDFLERVKTEGMLEDISGNLEEAKVEVKGDSVIVSPVELEGIFGTVTLELELKNEGGAWRIVGLDMSDV